MKQESLSATQLAYLQDALMMPLGAQFTNGDFESGFTGGVGNGWTSYWGGSNTAHTYASEGTIIHGGANSQRVDGGTTLRWDRWLGIRQTFDVSVGDAFVFEAWTYALSNSSNAKVRLLVDWTGGTDASRAMSGADWSTWAFTSPSVQILHTYSQAASTWSKSSRQSYQIASTGGVGDAVPRRDGGQEQPGERQDVLG